MLSIQGTRSKNNHWLYNVFNSDLSEVQILFGILILEIAAYQLVNASGVASKLGVCFKKVFKQIS